jgi:outer membrane murein-binding lipoprotein Lpp
MRYQNGNSQRMIVGLLGIALLLLSGCAGGVPQSEVDTLKTQVASQEQKSAAFQKELSDRVQEVSSLKQQVADKEGEVTTLQQKVSGLEKQAGDLAGVTVLIGAKVVPTPTPGPTATALPADFTPPPKPTTPASYYEQAGPFFMYVETLATEHISKYGLASTVNCMPNSVFKRGQRIVWRFETIDTSTGKRVTDRDEPTVTVRLPNGDELTARWSQRAGGRVPDAPWMWNTFWDIPLDYPLGAFDYSITVTMKDGRTGSWKQPALVSKDVDTRLQIVE